jgi:phosphoenolpyruvate synthase/pyruvate phosphate dikinase
VSIELAFGLGEILTSAIEEGNPYRLIFNKTTRKVTISEFANFSFGILPDFTSSNSSYSILDEGKRSRIDYTMVKYSKDEEELIKIGGRLGEIAILIEEYCKSKQDIEGVIHEDIIYIVQTRPQA